MIRAERAYGRSQQERGVGSPAEGHHQPAEGAQLRFERLQAHSEQMLFQPLRKRGQVGEHDVGAGGLQICGRTRPGGHGHADGAGGLRSRRTS